MTRSTRQRKPTARALAAQEQSRLDLGDDPSPGLDDVEDGVYIPPRKCPRTTKTSRSRVRRKGSLKDIMAMPVDVFAQIAVHLLPVDILNLSRTTKTLRSLLMQRSSAHIWRGAARNVPGLPPCPSHLSEPKYFSLLYSKTCMTCGANVTRPMDPYLYVRLCSHCRVDALIPTEALEEPIRSIIPMSSGIVPIHDKTMEYGIYSLLAEVEVLEAEYEDMKDDGHFTDASNEEAWISMKRIILEDRDKHSQSLRDFLRAMELQRVQEIREQKRAFRTSIETRLVEMGWEEGDLKFSWSHSLEWNPLVDQQKILTDRIWEGLYPKLEPLLKSNRERRLTQEREDRQLKRCQTFRKFWSRVGQKCGPYITHRISGTDERKTINKFLPSTDTVMEWPCLKPILDMDITADEMKKLVNENWAVIKQAAHDWRTGIEKQLADQLREDEVFQDDPEPTPYLLASSGKPMSRDLSLLLRADSIFQLLGSTTPRYFPDVLGSSVVGMENNIMSKFTRPESIMSHSVARQSAKALLDCLNMPNATHLRMKCYGKRFVCGRCHDVYPKTWEGMVMHYVGEENIWNDNQGYIEEMEFYGATFNHIHGVEYESDEPLIRLLSADEAEDYIESTLLWTDNDTYTCSVCDIYGRFDLDGVLAHLRDVHDVLEPELGDEYEDYQSYLEHAMTEDYSEEDDYDSDAFGLLQSLAVGLLGWP